MGKITIARLVAISVLGVGFVVLKANSENGFGNISPKIALTGDVVVDSPRVSTVDDLQVMIHQFATDSVLQLDRALPTVAITTIDDYGNATTVNAPWKFRPLPHTPNDVTQVDRYEILFSEEYPYLTYTVKGIDNGIFIKCYFIPDGWGMLRLAKFEDTSY